MPDSFRLTLLKSLSQNLEGSVPAEILEDVFKCSGTGCGWQALSLSLRDLVRTVFWSCYLQHGDATTSTVFSQSVREINQRLKNELFDNEEDREPLVHRTRRSKMSEPERLAQRHRIDIRAGRLPREEHGQAEAQADQPEEEDIEDIEDVEEDLDRTEEYEYEVPQARTPSPVLEPVAPVEPVAGPSTADDPVVLVSSEEDAPGKAEPRQPGIASAKLVARFSVPLLSRSFSRSPSPETASGAKRLKLSPSLIQSVRPPKRTFKPVDPEDPDIIWKSGPDSDQPIAATRSEVVSGLQIHFRNWLARRTQGQDPDQVNQLRDILEPWFLYLETERTLLELDYKQGAASLFTRSYSMLPRSPSPSPNQSPRPPDDDHE